MCSKQCRKSCAPTHTPSGCGPKRPHRLFMPGVQTASLFFTVKLNPDIVVLVQSFSCPASVSQSAAVVCALLNVIVLQSHIGTAYLLSISVSPWSLRAPSEVPSLFLPGGPVLMSITAGTLLCYDGSLESNQETPLNWIVYLINSCPVPPNDFSLLNSYIYSIQKNVDTSSNILRNQDPFYFFGNVSSENKNCQISHFTKATAKICDSDDKWQGSRCKAVMTGRDNAFTFGALCCVTSFWAFTQTKIQMWRVLQRQCHYDC